MKKFNINLNQHFKNILMMIKMKNHSSQNLKMLKKKFVMCLIKLMK